MTVRQRRCPQRGQVLFLFAAMMLLLAGMVAVTLGVTAKTREKIELQTSADAAAYSNAVATARTFNQISLLNRVYVGHMVAQAGAQSVMSWAGAYKTYIGATRLAISRMSCSNADQAYRQLEAEERRMKTLWEQLDWEAANQIRLLDLAVRRVRDAQLAAHSHLVENVLTGQKLAHDLATGAPAGAPAASATDAPAELIAPAAAESVSLREVGTATKRVDGPAGDKAALLHAAMGSFGAPFLNRRSEMGIRDKLRQVLPPTIDVAIAHSGSSFWGQNPQTLNHGATAQTVSDDVLWAEDHGILAVRCCPASGGSVGGTPSATGPSDTSGVCVGDVCAWSGNGPQGSSGGASVPGANAWSGSNGGGASAGDVSVGNPYPGTPQPNNPDCMGDLCMWDETTPGQSGSSPSSSGRGSPTGAITGGAWADAVFSKGPPPGAGGRMVRQSDGAWLYLEPTGGVGAIRAGDLPGPIMAAVPGTNPCQVYEVVVPSFVDSTDSADPHDYHAYNFRIVGGPVGDTPPAAARPAIPAAPAAPAAPGGAARPPALPPPMSRGGEVLPPDTDADVNSPNTRHDVASCDDGDCPSVWPVFLDYNRAQVNRADDLFGQPKNYSILQKDLTARRADPWNLFFPIKWAGANTHFDNRGLTLASGAPMPKPTAFSSGIAYYHRAGHWREPPNFLNPFWRATLVGIHADGQGEADIDALLQQVGAGPEREAYQSLRAAGYRGWP